jgi:TPR repeat protein
MLRYRLELGKIGTAALIAAVSVLTALSAQAASQKDQDVCANSVGEEAVAACTRIAEDQSEITENRADAYYARGVEYNLIGDHDRAIVDYREAIRLDPKNADFRLGRGFLNRKIGDYDGAVYDYNEAMRLDPKNTDIHNSHRISYAKRKSVYQTQVGRLAKLDCAEASVEDRMRKLAYLDDSWIAWVHWDDGSYKSRSELTPEQFLPAAEDGNVCAMYKVALLYSLDPKTEERASKAIHWYENVANSSNNGLSADQLARLQSRIAKLYLDTNFLNIRPPLKDEKISKGVRWYTASAGNGLADAQYKLAQIHLYSFYGRPSDPDRAEAEGLRWLRAALDQGYPPAYHELGKFHRYGSHGYPKDSKKTVEYFLYAAERGHYFAQNDLSTIYIYGIDGVFGSDKSHRDIVEGLRWAGIAGDEMWKAFYRVATVHIDDNNLREARYWAKKVGDEGNDSGARNLLKQIQDLEIKNKAASKPKIDAFDIILGLIAFGAALDSIAPDRSGWSDDQRTRAEISRRQYEAEQERLRNEIARDQEAAWGAIGSW